MSAKKIIPVLFVFAWLIASTAFARPLNINVLYLEQSLQQPTVLSRITAQPKDSGLKGAELGISDSNTTGRFLKHHYTLTSYINDNADNIIEYASKWLSAENRLIVANLPSDTLLRLANHPQLKQRTIIFNAGSSKDELRSNQCQSGLLHTYTSRAMLSDALVQYLIRKRWDKWFLIQGQRPDDSLFRVALERSAKRFGGKIIGMKTWSFNTDLRRVAQLEIPAFTQVDDYHITLVADESGDIGEYIPYNTWLPRPVAGTQGLTPTGWHHAIEQWGALQLQHRFIEHAERSMNSKDYAAWLAVRAIAEAVTRQNTSSVNELYAHLLSDQFELAAFKGRKLSFRTWNGQLRQPIPLVQPRALVSLSPQEGFLHPITDLDTLGFDEREVNCRFNSTLKESH